MIRVITTIVSILWFSVLCADNLNMYEELYPGCVDNKPSEIYDPKKWPKDLNLPEFPGGGEVEMSSFIYHNTDYVEVIDSIVPGAGPNGTDLTYLLRGVVLVSVTIDRCGRPRDVKVVQSVAEEYDAAAVAVVEGLPVFKPGDLNGVRVKVGLIVPVFFNRKHPKPVIDDGYMDYDDYESYDSYDSYDSYY